VFERGEIRGAMGAFGRGRRRNSLKESRRAGLYRPPWQASAPLQTGRVKAARYNRRLTVFSDLRPMSTPAQKLSDSQPTASPETASPLRFVTAASLFDGHDAAINIMRRLIQGQGAEVVHLGHNRSVEDVGPRRAARKTPTASPCPATRVGMSSTSSTWSTCCASATPATIKVFGGGGGTITPEEIKELQDYGVERIYHPNDGMHMGLVAMIEDVVRRAGEGRLPVEKPHKVDFDDEIAIGRMLSAIEEGALDESELAHLRKQWQLAGGKTPGRRHHRHRRRGQVVRHRRAAQPLPRQLPRHAHRGDLGRPDPSPHRRRAARRPHPHELAALRARLHALDGHPPPELRDEHGAQGLHRIPQVAGLRPRHRRDRRHRPVRLRRSSTSSTSRCT
jgi:methylmalonyl-CoA mutase cobalamin-binding subunit